MADELKPHERAYIEGTIEQLGTREQPPAANGSTDVDTLAGEIRPIDNPFFRVVEFSLGILDVKPIPACFLIMLDGTRVEHEFKTGRWYFVTDTYARIGAVDSALAIQALRALARKEFGL